MSRQNVTIVAGAAVGVFLASLYRSGGEIGSSLLAAVVTAAVAWGVLLLWNRRKS